MKNKSAKSSVLKWFTVLMVALLPLISQGQADTLVYHNFNSQCFLPAGWQSVNVDGGCAWRCDFGGFTQNNHSSQGCSGSANDWLITPLLDFDLYANEVLSLKIDNQYSGNALQIKYSSTYPGTGNPNSYSWTVLGTYSGAFYGNISMSAYSAKGYIAIHYTSSGNGTGQAARFTVNEVMVKGDPALVVASPTATNIDSTQAILGAEVVTSGGSIITERGIVWSTASNPVKGGAGVTTVNLLGTTGVYDTIVTGLPSGTRIYYKGFVSDSVKIVYTNQASFYTLSTEPATYPTSFTATAVGKNSIQLDWTQVSGAEGYLILQRVATAPTGQPNDATKYNTSQTLGDGQVVGFINSGATTTTTVNGLIQGTRYYYTLFPYNYNLVNTETYNYRTLSTVPVANDSTWGYPPSHGSTIEGVAGTGVISISSLLNETTVNDTNKGALAWRFQLRDGGTSLNDSDDLPTTVTAITLKQGANNTVTNWSAVIQSAGLFDDSTGALIKAASITSNTLVFSSINITAQDNDYRPLSLRISLKKIAHTDKSRFHFVVTDANVATKTVYESSQTQSFAATSDTLKNRIEVIATKLGFVANLPTPIEAGAFISQLQVVALDTFNGRDLDFNDQITIASADTNLIAGPRIVTAANGLAAFDTVRFRFANPSDTLIATAAGLIDTRSNRFVVENSKRSDIVVDGAFAYPQNIHHLNYRDTGAIEATNSLQVFSMHLRDGGKDGDADFEPTELTALTFNVSNFYALGKAALFANGDKIAEVSSVSASTQFAGFSLVAPDNDSVKITLQVTFKDIAKDGDRVAFTVTGTGVNATTSLMVAANAGGALSSSIGDDNKIDVIASKLVFVNQPVNVARGNTMYPFPTVRAEDNAGNIDVSGRGITVSASGSVLNFTATASVGIIPTKGYAEFSKLLFDVPSTGVTLIARATGLDSAISTPFDVLLPVWFRSIKSGNWSDISTWEASSTFGTTWAPATFVPDYSLHGYITIQTGHTVQMDGATAEANTVDELTIEKGAVLITPAAGSLKLAVNDALGDDIVVQGKLLHNNGQSVGGVDIAANANIVVKKAGVIEMASFGDAADWAGNPRIWFDDSAIYLHNTSLPNTIGAATMFPNALVNQVALFNIAQNTNFPGNTVNPADALVINGLLLVDANKTLTLGGNGERHLRNGIAGAGDVVIADSAKTRITGKAQLSGAGKIEVNSQSAVFQIAATSQTQLLNNKPINTTANNGITIAGQLNGLAYGFSGTATTTIEANATIITANTQGIDGLFANAGIKNFSPAVNYQFNATAPQNSGSISGNTARTIKVSNTNGLVLTGDIAITDTLYMGTGNVTTAANSLLTINKNAVINGYSSAAYINGPVKIWADSAASLLFPVGKTNYAPVAYITTNAAGWVTIEYNNGNPNTSSYDTAMRAQGLVAVKANEFWAINTTTNGSVQIPYTVNSAITGVDSLNIRVVSWDGAQWQSEGPMGRNATSSRVQSNQLKNYTVFTIGIDSACSTPATPTFTPLNVCDGSAAILAATGNGNINWYNSLTDNVPFATGNTANVGTLLSNTVFYTEVKNIGCYSPRVAYPVQITAIPAAPVVTGNTQLCYDATAQLTANVGGTTNWYDDVTATVPTYTGNALVSNNLTQNTSFYVEKEENGCPSTRTQVDVVVRAQIQDPYSLGADVCAGNIAVIKATANEDIHWYANTLTNIPFYTGEKYNTNVLFADTAYYLEAFEGTCKSNRIKVLVNVLALPAAPSVSQPSICEGSTAQLISTATTGQVFWYNDAAATIAVASGATFTTPALISSRNYYASVYDGKCYSPKASASVSVYTVPVNPTFTVVANTATNQNTTLQTTTVAQNYLWDFGADATPQTANGVGPHTVKWATQGTKTINLKVWNGNTAVVCSTEVQKTISVGAGLGIAGIQTANVVAYPNPINSGLLNIELGVAQKATITVTDATGRLIWMNETNTAATTINVDAWAAGMYFINVNTQQYNQTIKINKQ